MRYILLTFLCLFSMAVNAAVQVSVRPLTIKEGQSAELIISSDKEQSDAPDWTPLLEDFHIGGQMYAQQTSIINGQQQARYQYIVPLTPLRSGEIQIPSLTWGKEKTQPVVLSVQPVDSKDVQIFIEAQADKNQAYVGQSITYTARVYDKAGLSGGEFIPPAIEGGEVQKIGEPTASSETKDGKWYQVYEQKYILFAPKAGTLTIQPARFQGYVKDNTSQNRNLLSVFGMPDDVFYRGFVEQNREVALKAKPITLTVLPQPDSYQGWWLPATSVKFQQTFTPDSAVVQPGENIAQQIILTAQGVMPHQLPDIHMPDVKGFKIYPGEAQKTLSYNAQGLVSTLEKTFIWVPIQNGELTIPPVSVTWFDVQEKKEHKVTTQAHTVLVQGALPIVAPEEEPQVMPTPSVPEVSAYAQENSWLWFLSGVCVGVLSCVIGGLIAFLIVHKRKRLPDLYPY